MHRREGTQRKDGIEPGSYWLDRFYTTPVPVARQRRMLGVSCRRWNIHTVGAWKFIHPSISDDVRLWKPKVDQAG